MSVLQTACRSSQTAQRCCASLQRTAATHLVHVLAVGAALHDERVADADVGPEGALLHAQGAATAAAAAAAVLARGPPQPLVPGVARLQTAAQILVVLQPAGFIA